MSGRIEITPDAPFWPEGPLLVRNLNATIINTWVVMGVLVFVSWIVTRRLTSHVPPSRGQSVLEVLVQLLRSQIREVSQQEPGPYLPFVGTLFLYIAMSNLLAIVPDSTRRQARCRRRRRWRSACLWRYRHLESDSRESGIISGSTCSRRC